MAHSFAAPAPAAPKRSFIVSRSEAGEWIARERLGGIERRFASQKAALHFVLFELGERCASALLAPSLAQRGGGDDR